MDGLLDAVELTRELVAQDTVNPPGNEERCARLLGRLLDDAGFRVASYELAPGRTNLVADLPGTGEGPPLALTGHLDTVPLGAAAWSRHPFAGETDGGRLYGRGTSDMKAGVAAMVVAACRLAALPRGSGGLKLILTAAEETGCHGSALLARSEGALGRAGALLVGEPTANRPLLGHRGLIWLEARFKGTTAHGSMPHLGDNAAVKAARAVLALHGHDFDGRQHPVLGRPTLNVGWVRAGDNINSVPDAAAVGIDVRTVAGQEAASVRADLERLAGPEAALEVLNDAPAIWTAPKDPWAREVGEVVEALTGERPAPAAIDFCTDAVFLTPAFGGAPTVILGPGGPEQAHRTDEYAVIDRIEVATELYVEIARRWCGL